MGKVFTQGYQKEPDWIENQINGKTTYKMMN